MPQTHSQCICCVQYVVEYEDVIKDSSTTARRKESARGYVQELEEAIQLRKAEVEETDAVAKHIEAVIIEKEGE